MPRSTKFFATASPEAPAPMMQYLALRSRLRACTVAPALSVFPLNSSLSKGCGAAPLPAGSSPFVALNGPAFRANERSCFKTNGGGEGSDP